MVLMNLDSRYDRHLAQVEHVRVLSMALNDEEPHVRLQAVRIVGRLAVLNPANVMPSLRMELIKLLTELEYSTEAYVSSLMG
jgi:FKBP12-rapamycin complex-associated protein